MKKILPIISVVFICFSCGSDQLTKEKAIDIVKQQFPWKVSEKIFLFGSRQSEKLEPEGYVKFYRYKKKPSDYFTTSDISFNPNFIPFITNNEWKADKRYTRRQVGGKVEVYGGILKSVEIVNVFQSENTAEIEHRVQFVENGLHKHIARYGYFRYQNGQTFTIKQKAIKNSEGEWKLQAIKEYPDPD